MQRTSVWLCVSTRREAMHCAVCGTGQLGGVAVRLSGMCGGWWWVGTVWHLAAGGTHAVSGPRISVYHDGGLVFPGDISVCPSGF